MTRNLAPWARVIVDAPEIVAVRHRCERAVEWKDLEAVTRQIEFANDLRPQQRHYIRTHRKLEPGKNLFRHGRAAEHMPPLEHEHLLARARQVRRINQTVMPAANHDDVVLVTHCVVYRTGVPCCKRVSILIIARPDKHGLGRKEAQKYT